MFGGTKTPSLTNQGLELGHFSFDHICLQVFFKASQRMLQLPAA